MKKHLLTIGLPTLLFALVLVQPARAQFQLESAWTPGLCLGAEGGTVGLGKYLNASSCTGAAGQTFVTTGQSGGYRFAGSGTPYCITAVPDAAYRLPGSMVWVDSCKYASDGKPVPNQYFMPGFYGEVQIGQFCIAFTQPGARMTLDNCDGAHRVNQTWRSRAATPTAPPTGTGIALPITGINSQGSLIDARGFVIPGTLGSFILSGVPGGNVVAQGAGNYQISLAGRSTLVSTNGGNLAGVLYSGSGPVRVVAQGAGNFILKAGSTVLGVVAQGAGNVVAQGAGNVVATGAGNVVGTGGGSLQLPTSVMPARDAAQMSGLLAAGLIGSDGAGLMSDASSFLMPPNLVASSIMGVDAQGYLVDRGYQRILNAGSGNKLAKVVNGSLVFNPADISQTILINSANTAYVVSNDRGFFSVKNSNGQVIAAGAGNVVAAGAGNIVSHDGGTLISNSPARIATPNGANIATVNGANFQQAAFATGLSSQRAGMDAGDINSLNGKIAYYRNLAGPAPAPPPAPTPVGSGFQLVSFTTPNNAQAWNPSAPLPVYWSTSGTPATYQTVSVLLRLPGQNNLIGLVPPINVKAGSTSGSASVPAPRGLSQTTSATLILQNDANPSQYKQMAVTIVVQQAAPAYNGICNDAWVTKAVTAVMGRAPAGTANLGECATTRYGGGHWSSYSDLMVKVATAFNWPRGGNCSDLWIVQATVDVRGVLPSGSGTSAQCAPQNYHMSNPAFYANGRWASYAQLVRAVKDYYGLP